MKDNNGTTTISNERFLELLEIEKSTITSRIILSRIPVVFGYDCFNFTGKTKDVESLIKTLNKGEEIHKELQDKINSSEEEKNKLNKEIIFLNKEIIFLNKEIERLMKGKIFLFK